MVPEGSCSGVFFLAGDEDLPRPPAFPPNHVDSDEAGICYTVAISSLADFPPQKKAVQDPGEALLENASCKDVFFFHVEM